MSMTMQGSFAEGLIDRRKPLPEGVKAWTGVPPARRYGIYRSNVKQGLIQALAIRFRASTM